MVKAELNKRFNYLVEFLTTKENQIGEKELNEIAAYTVEMLKIATPKKTGLTAACWSYEVKRNKDKSFTVFFNNSNIQNGENVAILLDSGHASRMGHYTSGQHFIDPIIDEYFIRVINNEWGVKKIKYE